MKKYLSYIMMLVKSSWVAFASLIGGLTVFNFIIFSQKLSKELPFEQIIETSGNLYVVGIFAIVLLMYLYRRYAEKRKRGMLLPISGTEIVLSRVIYGSGWSIILTLMFVSSLFVQSRIYIAEMPEKFVTNQIFALAMMNTEFGRFIFNSAFLSYVLAFLTVASFIALVSIDKYAVSSISNFKIILLYVMLILILFISSGAYIKLYGSMFFAHIPIVIVILLILNIDVFAIRIGGAKDL